MAFEMRPDLQGDGFRHQAQEPHSRPVRIAKHVAQGTGTYQGKTETVPLHALSKSVPDRARKLRPNADRILSLPCLRAHHSATGRNASCDRISARAAYPFGRSRCGMSRHDPPGFTYFMRSIFCLASFAPK